MNSCVVGVWIGYNSVVPTTARESATSDSKENKQTQAGGRLLSKAFSLPRVVVDGLLRQQHNNTTYIIASSPPLHGKVPRLIRKKTNRLKQAVVFSRRHFLCRALLWTVCCDNNNTTTFFPPDWGMLRRSRCVLIFL